MYEVKTVVTFEAAHRLLHYDGKCFFCHGHSYHTKVCIACEGLRGGGFVIDFGDLKKIVKGWIDENWDHSLILNREDPLCSLLTVEHAHIYKMPALLEPTAENMAALLFDVVEKEVKKISPDINVKYVSIKETATNTAVYRRTK